MLSTGPRHPALVDALAELEPPELMRRYRWLRRLLLGLSLFLVPLTGLGLAIFAAGRRTWAHFMRIPGLDRTESQLCRVLSTLPRRDARGEVVARDRDVRSTEAVVVLVGFVLGIWACIGLTDLAVRLVGVPSLNELDGRLVAAIWCSSLLGLPLGLLVAARTLGEQWRRRKAARAERAGGARLAARAAGCVCWRSRYLAGEFADAYLLHHLQRGAAPPEALRIAAGPEVSVSRCPATDVPWLVLSGAGDTPRVLLRGTLDGAPEADDGARNGTGFYL